MLRPSFALLLALTALLPFERSLAASDDDMAWLAVSEAERVRRVRELIRAGKPRFAWPDSPSRLAEGRPYCTRLMTDFLSGVGVQPIEPVTILLERSVTPLDTKNWVPLSAIKRVPGTRRLDPSFSKAIERCATADAGNFDRFYQLDVGAPPYRIYRLSRSINPMPDAELVYWSEYSPKWPEGRDGYTWVDLNACTEVLGSSIVTSSDRLLNDFRGQLGALTLYEGRVVAWDVSRGFLAKATVLDRGAKDTRFMHALCTWKLE